MCSRSSSSSSAALAAAAACALLAAAVLATPEQALTRRKRIVGGDPAPQPPEDDPAVVIYRGDEQATLRGVREGPYYAFRGIRFAEPPVGRFRLQRPRRAFLSGTYNATKPPPPCPQPDPRGTGGIVGSEDCLFLNVFTPKLPDGSSGLPVLFWIHGGGYRRGSASQYGVTPLLNKNLVVVTIQYRLGSLGFLSGASKELPGNVGLFDMSLALDWVRDYIKFFGGNPNLIKACGQGTGASSAILLSLSKITQGFLGGIIALSGTALSTFAVDNDPLGTSRDLATKNGCPVSPMLAMVRCLQELPVESLIKADSNLQDSRLLAKGLIGGLKGLLGPAPVVDGAHDNRFIPSFLQDEPLNILKSGKFPKIPLLTGITKEETSTAILGDYQNDILGKLSTIPNYANQIVDSLGASIASVTNATKQLTSISSIYFNSGILTNPEKIISKLIEATGDALFSLPAFETSQLWSDKFPTYLYSFEHKGKQKGGPEFLTGLPLVQQTLTPAPNEGIGHGDDLPFLFDALPLDGNKAPGSSFKLTDPDDITVQDLMTSYIAEFAKTGVPVSNATDGKSTWLPFSRSNNNYLQIMKKPMSAKDFRYCQLAVWAGITERLQSTTCQAFNVAKDLAGSITDVKIVPVAVPLNTHILPFGG
uniref:Carboxylesterase n=1 Tax=Locusta migratoria TaxID=7004 RepID=W8EH35_LOCMI|nr:carboxylesterase [Locusta migratoria]